MAPADAVVPRYPFQTRRGEVSRRTFSGAFSTAFWSPDCVNATIGVLVKDFGLKPILEGIHWEQFDWVAIMRVL